MARARLQLLLCALLLSSVAGRIRVKMQRSQPWKVVRNFKAAAAANKNGHLVTLATQMGMNRLEKLDILAAAWSGAISCAVYISSAAEAADQLRMLAKHYEQHERVSEHVSLHTVVDMRPPASRPTQRLFPMNMLRNIAMANIR